MYLLAYLYTQMLLTLETESCEADILTYTVCQSDITNCNAI